MAIPDQCPSPVDYLNSTPALSSFPCDVVKALNLSNVDAHFQTPPPFDYSIYTTAIEELSSVGDPRWTIGNMYADLLDNIIPQAVMQTEILQAGGCQIIDRYICDADGRPIKLTLNTCASSISGVPINITTEYLQNYINSQMLQAKTKAADRFIAFLQTNYLTSGWTVTGYFQPTYNIFYLKIVRANSADVYIKYYPDQIDYLRTKLGIDIQTIKDISTAAGNFNSAVRDVLISPIANY